MTANIPVKPFSITAALDYTKAEERRRTSLSTGEICRDDSLQRAGPRRKNVRVEMTVSFMKIGEIDTLKENYEAEVMIKSKWREPSLDKKHKQMDPSKCWNPKLFIENTIGEPRENSFLLVVHNHAGEATIVEKKRIKGTFLENLELGEFPFDVQDLTVTVMSDCPPDEIQLVEDPDEFHVVNRQSFVDAQEWQLYRFIETEKREVSNEHEDPNVKRTALFIKCRAARRPAYFFWNIFLITFLISILSFVTFAVDRNLVQNRLQLSFTLVLTSVAFKFVVNQSLPKISYLTYLDKYVLVAMVMLSVVCVWHGLTTLVTKDAHRSADIAAMCVLAGSYIIFNISFIVRIYMKPWETRRKMHEKEKEYMERFKAQRKKNQMKLRFSNSFGQLSATVI